MIPAHDYSVVAQIAASLLSARRESATSPEAVARAIDEAFIILDMAGEEAMSRPVAPAHR